MDLSDPGCARTTFVLYLLSRYAPLDSAAGSTGQIPFIFISGDSLHSFCPNGKHSKSSLDKSKHLTQWMPLLTIISYNNDEMVYVGLFRYQGTRKSSLLLAVS